MCTWPSAIPLPSRPHATTRCERTIAHCLCSLKPVVAVRCALCKPAMCPDFRWLQMTGGCCVCQPLKAQPKWGLTHPGSTARVQQMYLHPSSLAQDATIWDMATSVSLHTLQCTNSVPRTSHIDACTEARATTRLGTARVCAGGHLC